MNIAYTSTAMEIWLQYIIYSAIIAVGIVVLMFIKRASRPPKHAELKARLTELLALVDSVKNTEQDHEQAQSITKKVNVSILKTKKLILTADALAQAEQDGDIDNLTTILDHARIELTEYKSGKYKTATHLSAARKTIAAAIELLDKIIERDAKLNRSKN